MGEGAAVGEQTGESRGLALGAGAVETDVVELVAQLLAGTLDAVEVALQGLLVHAVDEGQDLSVLVDGVHRFGRVDAGVAHARLLVVAVAGVGVAVALVALGGGAEFGGEGGVS